MNSNIFKIKYTGFLLIELVIAIGIFSMVAMLSLGFYWHINKLNIENEMEIKAINIASSCLENIQAAKMLSQNLNYDQYKVETVPISVKKGQHNKSFAIIKVIVSWAIFGKNKSVSLVTGVIV